MTDSDPSLNPPVSAGTKLKIPEGTLVRSCDKLDSDSEGVVQSVQGDTPPAGAWGDRCVHRNSLKFLPRYVK